MKIAGIVLAGGKSSRYGKPKTFETYQGKYFYQHSVEALKQNSLSPIVIATNENLISYFEQDDVLSKKNRKRTKVLYSRYIMHYQRFLM